MITGHAHRPPRLEFGQFAFETIDTRIHQIEVSRMYRLIDFTQNAPGPGQERFTYSMGLNGILVSSRALRRAARQWQPMQSSRFTLSIIAIRVYARLWDVKWLVTFLTR